MKRILSVALALLLVLGLLPVANAAELSEFGKIKEQEYVSGGERGSASSTSNNDMKNGKLFDAAPDVDVEEPKDTDIVSIIVELDGEPAMAVSESVKSASAAEAKLLEKQNLLQAEIENALGVKLDVKHNYTLLYNGFSFEGEYSLVKKIRDLGVNVYVSPEFEVPKMHTSVGLIGADIAWDYGYTGEGQTVAIIDTGIRLTHEAFSVVPENIAWTQETLQALVSAAGSNLNAGNNVSQLYKSGKIPFAYNYYSNNYNPGHGSSDHGSHVAGIAAGNNGSDFKGVAPDAQLVVMQVFTPMGGAYWSEILAALEDCAYLGVGAANMSLGSSCGFTDYNGDSTYERVLGLVADAGVNLSVAAGNDGATYEGNHWEGRQLASNPDYGVVGSPATFPESLCVAASNNLGGSEGVVEAYGESFAYNDRSGDPAVAFSTLNGEQEYVVVPGLGNPSDFTGIDVTGKIALIVRGEINFSDKVANAYQAGAIGVIIYNNEAGVINMAVDNYFVPAVSITQVAGQHLVNNATNGIGTLTVSGMDATGTPTAFSSRGTTADLKIKPEIMAPGANINSVDGFTSNSSYKLSDGTSMAAPHVAGGMAIVQEYVDEMFPNADESRKMELVDAILMSTAIPRVDGNGNPFVVREQGAGMMNLGNALTTTAYLSVSDNVRPKLEVGSSENGVFELNFTVNNFGDTALTYTINPIVITETPKVLGEYGGETVYYIDGTPYALNDVVELDMPESVTVPAGGTADVSVTVTLTDAAKTFFADHFDAGMFVEGFVELEGVADGEGAIPSTLNIPFLGFYGDWNHPAMIEEGAYYYQDEPTYSQVRENLIGYKAGSQIQGLGINPYVDMTEAQFLADRGAVSPNGDGWFESINVAYINLMRNASYAEYAVEINGSSTVLSRGTYVKKGHMPDGDPYQQMGYNYMSFPTWNASALTEGQSAVIKIRADLANEGYTTEANANGVWEVPVTKDLTAPEIVSVEVIEGGIRITFTDAHYVAYAKVYGNNDVYYDNGIFENERGANTTIDVMTTEPQVVLFLGDYAANESEYTINTATGEYEGGGQIDPPGPVETILYEWGFEDISEVAEWLTADADGDGQEWTLFRDASGEIPYEGTGFLGSYSYLNNVGPLTPDNWTITQNLTLPDDADEISLKYFIRGVDDTYFAENYSVYVGPANPSNTGQFTRLFGETIATAGWNEKVVDLSAYAGQTITIAFRHHGCTDQYTLALDNMSIVSTTGDEPPVTPTPTVPPTPTPIVPGDLDEALNIEGGTLTFANDEVYPWEVRDNYAASGNAGVVSSSSTVTTTVELAEGEALYFDWSVSSESGWDKLIFSVDGTAVRNISGEVDWTQFYYVAPAAGTYTFTWSYTKDGSVDRNNDEGYLDNVYVGEAPEVPEADMYAFNSFEGSWITFNSGDPSMATPVGAPGATVFAAEYVDGTVYGYTDAGQFFTTTLNNMSNLNVVGTIGEVIVDMAYNYATGMMYAIGSSENQEGPRTLYTVDLATGGITAVGSLDDTAVAAIMTLGITTEGEAYGISFAPGNQTNDSYLHTINLETAECEAIGPTGFPINYVQTMTYDHNNDQMLWAQFYSDGMFTQTSALVAVNLETGAGTQLGSTPVGGEVGELLGMFSVPGEGPTPPPADYTVEVGTVEANPGSTVRIPVTVNGLAAAAFELSYDADMFTYVGYTNPVAEAFVTVNDLVAGELTIAMMNYEANYEGEAIILEFAVAGECEDGEYEIPVEVISAAAIIDGATTNIDVSEVDATAGAINVVNGYTVTFMYNGEIIAEVTVPVGEAAEAPEMDRYIYDEETGYYHVFCGWDKDFSSVYENMTVNAVYGVLGDVNNDGTVNITDATMLMRGVVGMETLSELQDIIADVNCDGSVGISDATLIARFVTGLETFPVPMD